MSFGNNIYKYKGLFIIGVFAVTAFILRLSKWIYEMQVMTLLQRHLAYLGRNSLCIVIWHLLLFRVTILLQILIKNESIRQLTAFPVYDASGLWWLVYLITGIWLSLGWQYILERIPLRKVWKRNADS